MTAWQQLADEHQALTILELREQAQVYRGLYLAVLDHAHGLTRQLDRARERYRQLDDEYRLHRDRTMSESIAERAA